MNTKANYLSHRAVLIRVAWFVLPVSLVLSLLLNPYFVLATIAYMFFAFGIYYRKQRVAHVRLMASAIMIDVSLVVILELQRSAIDTAVSLSLNLMQMTHIAFSLCAVLLYLPIVYLGVIRYLERANSNQKMLHKHLGYAAFICRTIGFIFMFSMLK